MHILLCAWNWTFTQILTQPPAVLRHFRRCCQHSLWLQPSSHKSCQILSPFPSQSSSLLRSPSTLISVSSAVSSATQPHLGKPQHKKSLFIWALPVWVGGSKPLPGWFVAPIFRRNVHVQTGICMILPENRCRRVPVWVRGGVQLLFGQCPNELRFSYSRASLNWIVHFVYVW